MSSEFIHRCRSLLFSPESQLELRIRTLYHRFASTRIHFRLQNYLAKRSYRKYRSIQHRTDFYDISGIPNQPCVTFLIFCDDAPPADLNQTLQSIQSLQGDRWEVLLVASDNFPDAILPETNHPRIQHTRTIHPDHLELITGDYVIFCEAGDQFHTSLLWHFYNALSTHPSADLIYYDCEYDHEQSGELTPFFKPSALSSALLLSVNYLSRAFICRKTLQSLCSEVAPSPDLLNQEYDVILRLCEAGINIKHIPSLLVRHNRLATSTSPDNQHIIQSHLTRQGLIAVSSSQQTAGCRFIWESGDPSLAIVIPSKNNRSYLEPLVHSLLNNPHKGHISINIVDNGSDDPFTIAYYRSLQQSKSNITIIPYEKPFNYSEAINLGVTSSESDLVLLLNDDMALIDQETIPELIQWAIRPEVGVVGAKLLRANRTIQHAGIILGMTGFMGHIYLNAPENYNGLFGSVNWYRNYLALTGACQMMRREVFDEVGGYDPGYQLAFGDIAFCIKVHEKGYQNIFTPFAQLIHYEGSSRGYQTPVTDILRGYDQLDRYLVEGDSYFSPNLTYTRIPKCALKKRSHEVRQKQIAARKRFYIKKQ